MQTNGSLADTNLRALLEGAQAERATGTLTVRDGNGTATTLYFLFGHLFHAIGDGIMGDEAVVRALMWPGGEYDFDAKAKLPADETVTASIGDLVQRSEARAQEPPEAQAPEAAPAPPHPHTPEPPAFQHGEPEPAPAAAPAFAHEPHPEPARASEPHPEPARAPEPQPEPARAPEPQPEPARASEPEHEPAGAETPTPRRGVKHRPKPRHGREPIPVPAGQVIYDSLGTSFVDFPRLITTLERESYTGYVRLLTERAAGLILFRDGSALECAYDAGDNPSLALGRQALIDFNDEVTNGQGVLDVVSLSPELVDGLHQLAVARPMYSDLYASWVDPKALLRFLEDRSVSGSLLVRSQAGTGVIILTAGQLTGAYTSESRDISESADGVLALCHGEDAVIEVKAADQASYQALDVDAIVGSRRNPTGTTQTAIPVFRSEAQAPPPPAAPPPAAWAPEPAPTATPWAETPAQPPVPPAPPAWNPEATQSLPAQPAHEFPPMPAAAPASGAGVDWEAVVAELQNITEVALGNRARRVKDVLATAERSPEGMEAAIDEVPSVSILFVDSARLESLAHDLRTKLHSYLS